MVAIGGFNPTILTPDFLRDYCSFHSDHSPAGRTTPVLAEISFGNIQFLMELSKFQILLKPATDFTTDFPIDIMLNYLNVLRYTPLVLLGVNLNYALSGLDEQRVKQSLKDPFQLGKAFDITPTSVALTANQPNGKDLELTEVSLAHQLDPMVKQNIKITFVEGSLIINENYEVAQLEKNRETIEIIRHKYPAFLLSHKALTKRIEDM